MKSDYFFFKKNNNIKAIRFNTNPIITASLSNTLGDNINGPSLIKVPAWLPDPLGKYYLYFAHHNGKFIRLAYSEHLEGPWNIYESGTLKIGDTICQKHIASPDVHVDTSNRQIRMYFHGPVPGYNSQKSLVALSDNGIHFIASPEILGNSYFRVFNYQNYYYAMARSGQLYRSRDGLSEFEIGENPFNRMCYRSRVRHVATYVTGNILYVFYSRIHDKPERILVSKIELDCDWFKWRASKAEVVLSPVMEYEGVNLPLSASLNGIASCPARQLRDPAIFQEDKNIYLLYSVAGEQGLAIAQIIIK